MIAAELARQKNGRYPDAMDDLLTDPFSDKPLKYAIAKVEISEQRFQLNEDPTRDDITPELQKQLGMTDEQLAEFSRPRKYVFKTEHRTVDAVQIWSVGPNGIDDNGIRQETDLRQKIRKAGEHLIRIGKKRIPVIIRIIR